MLAQPVYRASIIALTLAAAAGAVVLLATPSGAPGIEISPPMVTAGPVTSEARPSPPALERARVDINTATAAELAAALPSIGEVLSARIVAYREANGPFARTDLVMAVRGIGPVTYERIRPLITVGE